MSRPFIALIVAMVGGAEAPAYAAPVGDAASRKALAASVGASRLSCTKSDGATCTP